MKDVEQDKKRAVFTTEATEQISDFVQFLVKARDGKSKRMVETFWPNKAIKLGRALVQYAKSKELGLTTEVSIKVDELEQQLEKVTGTKYMVEAEDHLADFLLVKKIDDPQKGMDELKFTPHVLGRTIAHVICYQKLSKLDYRGKEEAAA